MNNTHVNIALIKFCPMLDIHSRSAEAGTSAEVQTDTPSF